MYSVVIYPEGDGVGVLYPANDMSAEVIAGTLPEGTPYKIVPADQLPSEVNYRDAWVADFADAESLVVEVDPDRKAAIEKQEALAALDDWFAEQIDLGFATADGWKLGLTLTDVTLLTGNYVLARESAALGGPIPPIFDRDGVPHEIEEIEELTAIMLAYGQHRAAISAEYAAKKAALLEG